MAARTRLRWLPLDGSGLPRSARQGSYIPDPLATQAIIIPSDLVTLAARVERKIVNLSRPGSGTGPERIAPGPDKVAIAELAQDDLTMHAQSVPQLVAHNH